MTWIRKMLSSYEKNIIWIICKNYTPNGVVVVVIEIAQITTIMRVVIKQKNMFLLFFIVFKFTTLNKTKKLALHFYEILIYKLIQYAFKFILKF
jgi:hypothetical protein